MRHIRRTAVFLAVLLTVGVMCVFAGNTYLKGDVDHDGFVRANDARSVLRYAAMIDAGWDIDLTLADFNGDGNVRADDARRILRVSADIEQTFEIQVTDIVEETSTEAQTISCDGYTINEEEATMIAKTMWGEAQGLPKTEQAAVAWCILNRVDKDGFPNTIKAVVTQAYQFYYRESHPCTDELYDLACDVLTRWYMEKDGYTDVGRTLPAGYCFFNGDGRHNYFRQNYNSTSTWDWSLPSPY